MSPSPKPDAYPAHSRALAAAKPKRLRFGVAGSGNPCGAATLGPHAEEPRVARRLEAGGSNPLEGFLVDFLGIRLEHQPFARTPAPRIHLGVETVGEFILVIMRV